MIKIINYVVINYETHENVNCFHIWTQSICHIPFLLQIHDIYLLTLKFYRKVMHISLPMYLYFTCNYLTYIICIFDYLSENNFKNILSLALTKWWGYSFSPFVVTLWTMAGCHLTQVRRFWVSGSLNLFSSLFLLRPKSL